VKVTPGVNPKPGVNVRWNLGSNPRWNLGSNPRWNLGSNPRLMVEGTL
jgi:hypothetical protein